MCSVPRPTKAIEGVGGSPKNRRDKMTRVSNNKNVSGWMLLYASKKNLRQGRRSYKEHRHHALEATRCRVSRHPNRAIDVALRESSRLLLVALRTCNGELWFTSRFQYTLRI